MYVSCIQVYGHRQTHRANLTTAYVNTVVKYNDVILPFSTMPFEMLKKCSLRKKFRQIYVRE